MRAPIQKVSYSINLHANSKRQISFFKNVGFTVTVVILCSLCFHAKADLHYSDNNADHVIPSSGEEFSSPSYYSETTDFSTTTLFKELDQVAPIEPSTFSSSYKSEKSAMSFDTTPQQKTPVIFYEHKTDKQILDDLLDRSGYDNRTIPRVPGGDPLNVTVDILLLSLASPDESSLKYEVEFLLSQEWIDPRLRYGDNYAYDFLNALHHTGQMWVPDTYFIMHGDFKDPLIPLHFSMTIHRNGTIRYTMRRHLILSCRGDVTIFPFDDPLCEFSLESISYETSELQYIWKNDKEKLRKSPSLSTLNAYMIYNQTKRCSDNNNSWRGNYSCLQVDLRFSRDRTFYFTTVFIPGIILVTSSFVSFWLEWNAVPARSMIGVTTMLNFFTSSNSFRGKLPVVSNLTAMNIWDGACMCFIYISLLEFICVNYVGRKRPMGNMMYKPKEPKQTIIPPKRSRLGSIFHMPLDTIEREFLVAMSAEKPTPPSAQKKRPRFSRRKKGTDKEEMAIPPLEVSSSTKDRLEELPNLKPRKRGLSASAIDLRTAEVTEKKDSIVQLGDFEVGSGASKITINVPDDKRTFLEESFGNLPPPPNFVDLKQKEAPHPIRVAKTIDVIARIMFPVAFGIFLIVFFIIYAKHDLQD